jgi:predicted nucleotidyltransferase
MIPEATIHTHHDRTAVETLLQRLLLHPSLQVQGVILYGSKARHDDTPDSDIDLLVLVADDAWPVREQIRTIGAQLSLEYDVLFHLVVIGQARWEWMEKIRHPLYRSIAMEGIELTPEPTHG